VWVFATLRAELQPRIVDKIKTMILQNIFYRSSFSHMLRFPFAGFEVQHIIQDETLLTITACTTTERGVCPSCGEESGHIHRFYQRHPQDLPISGLKVQLVLQVQRFRCKNLLCSRQTFAERLPALPLFARQTLRLAHILESIAVVLSGQAGSR
jgi:transposase